MSRLDLWLREYQQRQQQTWSALPLEAVARLVERLRAVLEAEGQVFVFGNGGSAANASHFATDLGKGASDRLARRFRVLSLTDNTPWMTALGNDYSFDDVFVRQLQNYARPGDLALALSVSGQSPNVVRAVRWAREHGLYTAALVGGQRGALADLAELTIVIPDTHYGRVEDAQMTICHMLAYAFMEGATGAALG
ncbi:MAG: SIS domain-containing protein [Gemmataceae bacterium]|nr:SIS domain-containing protein [Gemmataceae bacterium]MDW8265414.1 SIS domain-containing protein [Gemmataceae bacterium]